jgi:cyclopropane fatty-acyl-phospholipid synthase-like methyltransferase
MYRKEEDIYGKEEKPHLGGYIVNITEYGDPNTYSTEIWDWMKQNGIKSVIDVGCGEGYSTKYFINIGIDTIGIEGGNNAYNNSPVKDNLILHDYVDSPYIPEKKYDAVWCCEFVEHVEEKYSENFLRTFDFADKIFMTHAVVGQEGYHHVNCQNSEYWIEKIEKRGFKLNKELSTYLRSITDKIHVKHTLLVFEK